MYLKRLELVGFKSFAARTTLELVPGICVVVGPNGSGKSNLADAIRWALGEQSARAVRCRRSEDVVFAGGSGRAPAGMAEVTLILDNGDGRLPLPLTEVAITRRLYRTGESEYELNRARARLKDVVDWAARAGLGAGSYTVVGQGTVEELVLQRTEERRALLEDAADIRRHQARLAECETKLAATAENLARCEDLIAELAPQVERLARLAERARRHASLSAELQALGLAWYRHTALAAQRHLAAAEAAHRQAVSAAAELAAAREAAVRRRAHCERARAEAETRARAAESAVHQARAARDEAARCVVSLRERCAAAQQRMEELAAATAAREREASRARAERDAAEHEVAQVEGSIPALRARVEELRALREAERRAAREARAAVEAAARRADQARAALAAAQQEQTRYSERARAAAEQAARARAEREALAARRTGLEETLARRRAEVGLAAEALAAARQESAAARRRLETLEAERQRLAERELALRRELERVAVRRAALAEAVRAAPGDGAAAELEREVAGLRGKVGAFLRVPPEYTRAIAAALDDAAGYVVAADGGSAAAALRLIDERGWGRTVLTLLSGERRDGHLRFAATFGERVRQRIGDAMWWRLACEAVECDPEMREIATRYLGATLLVRDLASATTAYRQLLEAGDPLPFQVVTLAGQVLRSSGEWVAGRDDRHARLLAFRVQDERLAAEQARLEAELAGLTAPRAHLERERQELLAAEGRARGQTRELEASWRRLQDGVRERELELRELERERERLQGRNREAERAREEAERLAEAADIRARDLAADLARVEAAHRELLAQASSGADESEGGARLAAAERELAGAEAESRARAAHLAQARRRATEAEAALASARRAHEQAAAAAAALADQLAAAEAALAQADAALTPLQSALEAAGAAVERARADLEYAEASVRRLEEEWAAARERELELRTLWQRARDRVEQTRREATELLGEALPQEVKAAEEATEVDAPAFDAEAALRRMRALQRELRQLGGVDPDAIAEHSRVAERHAFLTTQAEDLRAAAAQLRATAAELQELLRERFVSAFRAVDAAFRESFATLFGGGTAQLVLTRPEDPLSGGVEVVAHPPGKRAQPLLALSGGERALTAVALLFALLRVNPSPVCVLDEVDAALDESNVRRFAQMLRGLSERIQFIVITHNRATMEAATALYGVTMQENSVSRILSLRLEDAAEQVGQ